MKSGSDMDILNTFVDAAKGTGLRVRKRKTSSISIQSHAISQVRRNCSWKGSRESKKRRKEKP